MNWIILLIVLAAVLALVVFAKRRTKEPSGEHRYESSGKLVSPAERSFLGVLDQAVGADHRVFAKVRLADVIRPRGGGDAGKRQGALNRIVGKHLDFLLCRASDLSIVGAIELDDRSHAGAKQKTRDRFVESALQAASVPLLRFPAKASYSLDEVKGKLTRIVEPKTTSTPEPPTGTKPPAAKTHERKCPECAATMVLRTAAKGEHAGKQFWGCSNYPRCKTVLPA